MRSFRGNDGLYHYLYKTTNNINNKYYFGIHSTDDLDDGYLGSGVRLKRAIKKYGRNNFTKNIISFYQNRLELSAAERLIVNENVVIDKNSYNMILGGDSVTDSGGITTGMVTVKNSNGDTFLVRKNDPKYISGEYKFIRCGIGAYRDPSGNIINTSINDPRVLSGELVGCSKGMVTAQDKATGRYVQIRVEDYNSSKYALPYINLDGRKNYRWVKKDGNVRSIHVSELQEYLDNGWIIGNHHKDLICVTRDGKNTRINKSQLQEYLDNGWVTGTSQRYNSGGTKYKGWTYVHKNGICKRVKYADIITYLDNGWSCGMRKTKSKQYMHNNDGWVHVGPELFEELIRKGYKFGKK